MDVDTVTNLLLEFNTQINLKVINEYRDLFEAV